jgi:hypothetical protein
MAEYKKPIPVPNSDSEKFWEGCKKHELLLQKCDHCSSYRYPPRSICPNCFSVETTWDKVSGKGEVYTYTIARVPLNPAWEPDIPYTLAVVLLDEGVKMVTNIVDCQPEDVKIGMKVEVVFDDVTEDITLLKFRPSK